jgi:hypothetical protein
MIVAAKLAASLVSILVLAWLARWLKLGGDPRIADAGHAMRLAFDGQYGFVGIDAAVDKAGMSALVRDAQNRHVLVNRVGNRFVTRMIAPPVQGRLDQKLLTIDLGEAAFPAVTLNLGDQAQYWASGLRHLPHA